MKKAIISSFIAFFLLSACGQASISGVAYNPDGSVAVKTDSTPAPAGGVDPSTGPDASQIIGGRPVTLAPDGPADMPTLDPSISTPSTPSTPVVTVPSTPSNPAMPPAPTPDPAPTPVVTNPEPSTPAPTPATPIVSNPPTPTPVTPDPSTPSVPVSPTPVETPTLDANMWLHTQYNTPAAPRAVTPGIFHRDNSRFMGRGPVITDLRGCDSCTFASYGPKETMARVDLAVDVWHASFIRLAMESYHSATEYGAPVPRVSWESVLFDDAYMQGIKAIVDHVGTKKGVYVMLSMWRDQSLSNDDMLWPTVDDMNNPGARCAELQKAHIATSTCVWQKLAKTFKDYPYVMFNVAAEPAWNFDGAHDAQVWALNNACVQAIRNVEDAAGTPHHLVTVSGTKDWGRNLQYYAQTGSNGQPIMHPITAGGGANVVYQTHPYNAAADFQRLFVDTSQYLPILVGEFGPQNMSLSDCGALIDLSEAKSFSYTAWALNPRCGVLSMITESGNVCDGSNASTMTPTEWGAWYAQKLQQANP